MWKNNRHTRKNILKNNQFLYNLKGIGHLLYPNFLGKYALSRKLKQITYLKESELKIIAKRVKYYCSFDKTTLQISANPSHFELLSKGSRYFFDTYEHMKYFSKDLVYLLEFGDVNYHLEFPSLCKSRPISQNNGKNVLLKLDKLRHFNFFDPQIAQKIPYEDKKNILFFRGGCYQPHRQDFIKKYFHHPLCDLGHVGKPKPELVKWQKQKIALEEHLQYKFILSLEGNEVASNLKWLMSSNSVTVMPKPKFETWFMEATLKPNQHYIEIDPDYGNLQERLEYYLSNPQEAKDISHNANIYVKQFFDKQQEDLISFLVIRKYFYLTGQIEISKLEEEIFCEGNLCSKSRY